MGDWSWWSLVQALGSARAPLVHIDVPPSGGFPRGGHLRVTDAGQRVLAGDADHVALNGIDRWMGGVHLTDGRWRWTGSTLVNVER